MSSSNKRQHSPSKSESRSKCQKSMEKDVINEESQMFHGFEVDEILSENSQNKVAFIHGHFIGVSGAGDNTVDDVKQAVVILEKTPFSEESIRGMLKSDSQMKCTLKNDIYHTIDLMPPKEYSGIKTTLICPATQKHIDKYKAQDVFMLQETCDNYNNITKPYLDQEQFSIQWVYNILEKKKEADRIVYEDADPDTGFILLPDMKWDRKQLEDLYLVAIVQKHNIKSLRDLNDNHLPLLINILEKGTEAIKEKFGVPSSKLRIYLHYQPSYYHLHVHFTHIKFQAPGSGVERAHLLSDVIQNIQIDSQYYTKKSLSFTARDGDKLFQLFKAADQVQ